MSNAESLKTNRTTVKRHPERGAYDWETIAAILDEGFLCHVGFVVDGAPYVLPMAYARDERDIVLHGSVANRMLRAVASGGPVAITVTLVDGLVLARSAMHHSMNYRSVSIFGCGVKVEERSQKQTLLHRYLNHVVPGRASEAREANDAELDATVVVRVRIEEASAKMRSGPPVDDASDLARPCWAGVLPLSLSPGTPIAAPDLASGSELPDSLISWRRGRAKRAASGQDA